MKNFETPVQLMFPLATYVFLWKILLYTSITLGSMLNYDPQRQPKTQTL